MTATVDTAPTPVATAEPLAAPPPVPPFTVQRATSIMVGAFAVAWDRAVAQPAGNAPTPSVRWRDLAVGVAFGAEDRAGRLLSGVARRAGHTRQLSASVAERGRVLIVQLAERGASERDRSRYSAVSAARDLLQEVATSQVINRIVDAQLDRTLRPLVATVLDDVLALLDAEPERVRRLMRDQRATITDELVEHIRGGAMAGDTAVERMTARLLGRRPAHPTTVAAADPL